MTRFDYVPDIVPKAVRSRMMAGIRGKNTKPEVLIRKQLFARGYRYILHDARLPGKPDLVFPKYHAVIEINGCFWHRHKCSLFKWPTSRVDFWRRKLERNHSNDLVNGERLRAQGWRVLTLWECALRGPRRLPLEEVLTKVETFLKGDRRASLIQGRHSRSSAR